MTTKTLYTTPGKHEFHQSCINDWSSATLKAGQTATCPLCRAKLA